MSPSPSTLVATSRTSSTSSGRGCHAEFEFEDAFDGLVLPDRHCLWRPAPASAAGSAEGFWTGTASSGDSLLGTVLDNGEYWVMYHANGFLYGVVRGVGRLMA